MGIEDHNDTLLNIDLKGLTKDKSKNLVTNAHLAMRKLITKLYYNHKIGQMSLIKQADEKSCKFIKIITHYF